MLDLGAGTGVFSYALAHWFDIEVLAVEPADAMRREAQYRRPHPRVTYLAGDAEHIPLGDGCCDSAWLSTVIHHIPDLRACARELRRVLHPSGRVFIRSAFPGRLDGITLFRFFPEAKGIAETFPSIETTVNAFAAAAFEVEALESVPQITATSRRAWCERVRLRADTTLAALSDDKFVRGMEALECAAVEESSPVPVIDRLDLLVLASRRGPPRRGEPNRPTRHAGRRGAQSRQQSMARADRAEPRAGRAVRMGAGPPAGALNGRGHGSWRCAMRRRATSALS